MPIKKIISGGQTGADQAALDVAIEAGIPHGGWIPKGRRTEDGPLPDKYRLHEMRTGNYEDRTEKNVLDSDGTLIFSHGPLTGGSALTRELALRHGKPSLHIDFHQMTAMQAAQRLVEWIGEKRIAVLNVAGPRASQDPQIYGDVRNVLKLFVGLLKGDPLAAGGAEESRYELALEAVTEWVEELMSLGYQRKEALESLLILVELRMFATQNEDIGEYKTELQKVIRSQLGKTQ